MGEIIEAGNLPNEEKVYLKKDFLGWRVVNPIIDPENRKLIWKNVFNPRGFILLAFILLLILLIKLSIGEMINNYQTVVTNPCSFCVDCQDHARGLLKNLSSQKIELPNISLFRESSNG